MVAVSKSIGRAADRPELRLVADSAGELLGRIAGRDLCAFEELYGRYARPVFAMAVRKLRDRGQAEDAVQEAFTAVWRSAASYRPERGPGAPWLFAIVRNAVVDSARASSRARVQPAGELPETASTDPAPDQSVEGGWVSFCVHAALAELPERERVLIELAYSKGHAIVLCVRGLRTLPAGSYYDMYLTDKGRLVGSCGTFKTDGGTTVVRLNVPYRLGEYSGWIIRREHAHQPPSPPLLTT